MNTLISIYDSFLERQEKLSRRSNWNVVDVLYCPLLLYMPIAFRCVARCPHPGVTWHSERSYSTEHLHTSPPQGQHFFVRCRVLMSIAVTTTHLNIRRFTTRRIIGTCPRCQYGPTLTTLDTKIRSPYCQTIITLLSKVEHSPFRIKVRRVFANYIKLIVRVFFFQRSPGLLPHAPLGLDTTLAPP